MKKPSQETLNKYQSHPEIIETIDYECKNNSISKKKLIIIITGLIINFTALILNTISKSSQIILNIAI
jgi:hypothetical protein